MRRMTLISIGALALLACGRGDRQDGAADSTGRDLSMLPGDSTHPLGDRDAAGGAAKASGARAETGHALAAGTKFTAVTASRISSATDKAGESITARVSADVKDGDGRVVIPAGSTVRLRIAAIHESENKSDETGTLRLAAESVEIDGKSYSLSGSVSVPRTLVGRKTNVNDVAKVGVGAGAGAVAGRVVGGGKGTGIGGGRGGAGGAPRAVETKDRDVVVAAGSTARIELTSRFER